MAYQRNEFYGLAVIEIDFSKSTGEFKVLKKLPCLRDMSPGVMFRINSEDSPVIYRLTERLQLEAMYEGRELTLQWKLLTVCPKTMGNPRVWPVST